MDRIRLIGGPRILFDLIRSKTREFKTRAVDSGVGLGKRQAQSEFTGPLCARRRRCKMAKPTTIKIRLNSTAGTGHFYVTKKNARTMTEKMVVRKYDPVVRKHVEYKEGKIK